MYAISTLSLGECILISSLPGKALRTLVDSTCILKAEPSETDNVYQAMCDNAVNMRGN